MGQMHVVRALCSGVEGISVVGADIDDARLEALAQKAAPWSARAGVPLRLVNTAKETLDERFSYQVVLVPSAPLVAAALDAAADHGLVDIFAGIPAGAHHEVDLDAYIARRCYMFGTSGSVVADMKVVLAKLGSGRLDTDCSIDAVSGMAGAIDGVAAVEHQRLAGKVVVYPALHDLGLVRLAELGERLPTVAAKLAAGQWTKAAEAELLAVCRAEQTGPGPTAPDGPSERQA
jgi:hypothetical protein